MSRTENPIQIGKEPKEPKKTYIKKWSYEANPTAKEVKLFDFNDHIFFIRQTTRVLEPLPLYVCRELKKLGLIPDYLQEEWRA